MGRYSLRVDTERWLAPLVGVIAIGSAVAVVAVYAFGETLGVTHDATVATVVPGAPEAVFAALAEPSARREWAPHVARVGRVEDAPDGRSTWRELDEHDDRFEFVVVSDTFPTFEIAAAKPEEIGMAATWTWTVAPSGSATEVRLRERGDIANPLFRGVWGLRTGAYGQIERDLGAFGRYVGGDGAVRRVP